MTRSLGFAPTRPEPRYTHSSAARTKFLQAVSSVPAKVSTKPTTDPLNVPMSARHATQAYVMPTPVPTPKPKAKSKAKLHMWSGRLHTYRELQQLCKANGLRAVGTAEVLLNRLMEAL